MKSRKHLLEHFYVTAKSYQYLVICIDTLQKHITVLPCATISNYVQDQSHCTSSGFKTIENRNKPLFLKELKKIWDKEEPNLPWEKGEYTASNTLLLDDSPYKALRNPVRLHFSSLIIIFDCIGPSFTFVTFLDCH